MKKYFLFFKGIIFNFFRNSFWRSAPALAITALSLILDGFLWYIFITGASGNSAPFLFATGLVVLNLVLANFLWERERLASFFLISTALFSQILMFILIRFLIIGL